METSLELVNPQEFGIEEKTANELTTGLKQVLAERDLLQSEFETVSVLEINETSIPMLKELRLRIVKNRTQGINAWHKAGKEYFLRGGQFLDAIRRKEIQVNENMERVLEDGEKHFENLEIERKKKLQNKRVEMLSPFVEDAFERDLVKFEEDEFAALLQMKKKEFEDRIAAEKKAEEDRIAQEKKDAEEREAQRLENLRLKAEAEKREAEIEAQRVKREKEEEDRLEKERVENAKREAAAKKERDQIEALLEKQRKENQRIAKEAEEKAKKERQAHEAELEKARIEQERIQKEEEAKRQALEKEIQDRRDAEIKALADAEAAKQSELNKGDADKVKDLVADLSNLKTKYTFKSAKNSKMYADVSTLIDKVINHINK